MISILVLVVTTLLLVLALNGVSLLMAEFVLESREEASSYECGFEHNGLSRIPFSFRYFLLTMLFLLFDLEILLLLGVVSQFSVTSNPVLSGVVCLFFVVVLFVGWFYEYTTGSLDWCCIL